MRQLRPEDVRAGLDDPLLLDDTADPSHTFQESHRDKTAQRCGKSCAEPVGGVVGHQHDRSHGGDVLAVLDPGAAEEHPGEHSGQRNH